MPPQPAGQHWDTTEKEQRGPHFSILNIYQEVERFLKSKKPPRCLLVWDHRNSGLVDTAMVKNLHGRTTQRPQSTPRQHSTSATRTEHQTVRKEARASFGEFSSTGRGLRLQLPGGPADAAKLQQEVSLKDL